MANPSSPQCQCRQKQRQAIRKDQRLGLDELMIVNPSTSGTVGLFLGEDGTLYQVQGLGEEAESQGTGEFFLGKDGTLYQVQGVGAEGLGEAKAHELGRYFLGEDGALYELVR
ncbi:MAG TPA: hypothetical protein VNP04_31720 [Alphaproteobacteria bacterium]|nr:hypothetical protein [Alphaproteobacteria bacterium]